MNLIDKLPVAVIIVAVIAALFFHSSVKKIDEEIAAINKEKILSERSLNRYADIEKYFGRASDEFYSSKPIVILRGNGDNGTIPVYWARNTESGITAHFNENILNGTWGSWEGNWSNLNITSKVTSSYTTVNFTNKANDEKFSVLVIVK